MNLQQFMPAAAGEYHLLLAAAFAMAEQAGAIHMKYFRNNGLEQTTKLNDSDVVTIADKEAEAAVIGYIRRHFPEHGIIAEESGTAHSDSEWCWVVDPLDGTTNFSAGLPVFCVSIGLKHNGETVLGVVFAPYLEECFYAVRGEGAWFNGKPVRCSEKEELSKAVVSTGLPYDRFTNPDNNLVALGEMPLHVRALRLYGSAAMDLCYTAAGIYDAYWELNLKDWDVCAGELISREAGAVVEAIRCDRNHSLLVSGPHLYPAVRRILLK